MLSEKMIENLVNIGGNRWTKGNYDRIYFSAESLGLKVERYHTGNISHAEYNGKKISHSSATEIINAKIYVDVNDGKIHSNNDSSIIESMIETIEKILDNSEIEESNTMTEKQNGGNKTMKNYYICDSENFDTIYGDQYPVCITKTEIMRLSTEWEIELCDLMEQFHEASESEIAEYGVYDDAEMTCEVLP